MGIRVKTHDRARTSSTPDGHSQRSREAEHRDAHASDLRMRNPFLWPSPLSRSAAGLGCELRLTSGSQSVGLFGCLTNGSAFVEPAASDADDGQLGQRAGEEAAARAFVEQVL